MSKSIPVECTQGLVIGGLIGGVVGGLAFGLCAGIVNIFVPVDVSGQIQTGFTIGTAISGTTGMVVGAKSVEANPSKGTVEIHVDNIGYDRNFRPINTVSINRF